MSPFPARLLLALALGATGAACKPQQPLREATLVLDGVAVDSLFRRIDSTTLSQTDTTIIGSLVNLAVSGQGNILVSDMGMRDAKAYSRDGHFIRRLGRQGRGPGEAIAPVYVSVSPYEGRVVLTDIAQSRLLLFDRSLEAVTTLRVESPVSLHAALLERGDTLLLFGVDRTTDGPGAAGGAYVVGSGRVIHRVTPVPPSLQRKALTSNLLYGVGGQAPTWDFFALNANPVIYRGQASTGATDSIGLPLQAFRPVKLVDVADWKDSPSAMSDFMRTQEWLTALAPLNDTALAFEIVLPAPPGKPLARRLGLLTWGSSPRVWTTKQCSCRIIGAHADTIGLLQADSTGNVTIEWRTVIP